MSSLADYQAAEQYVNSLIMGPPSPPPDATPAEIRERAVHRLDRLRDFMAFMGNPQDAYPIIHITGTSGKGSTSTTTAAILSAAGFRTGLHVSPYLQVATEKLQIDGHLISATRYRKLVKDMRDSLEAYVSTGKERPNYGEFWVAMSLRYLAEEKVDAGVIEVGAGGRFDVTNIINGRVNAVTSIGLDHVVTLGNTLESIAWHKAGIFKPNSVAVSAVDEPGPASIIAKEAWKLGIPLRRVRAGESFREVEIGAHGTSFVDDLTGERFETSLVGAFQAANAATAMAITRAFAPEQVTSDVIRAGLQSVRFPGRMEFVQRRPEVMLDGAHNPQKMESLAHSIGELYPDRRIILVFGALESKGYDKMLDIIGPHGHKLIATTPRGITKPVTTAAEIASIAPEHLAAEYRDEPLDAIERALELAHDDDVVLVTGSLYLVGNVREHWYPKERILGQGTSWPLPD